MAHSEQQSGQPRLEGAIVEIKKLILDRFPNAQCESVSGDDPSGIYLIATVDVDDVDIVIDCYAERLLDIQIEEELPLYVVPVRPAERVNDDTSASTQRASALAD